MKEWPRTSKLVKSIRLQAKLSREEFAESIGVSSAFVWSMENSAKPVPPRLARVIEKKFKTPFSELLNVFVADSGGGYLKEARKAAA